MEQNQLNQTAEETVCKDQSTDSHSASQILSYPFLCAGSFLYALFYTFCLYRNPSGITYPFFVGGTLLFFFLCLKKYGITAKKDSVFFIISLMLLGISTCLTDSYILHSFNTIGIFILMFTFFIHTFYDDKAWNIPKYLFSICNVVFTSLAFFFNPFSDFTKYREINKNTLNKKSLKMHYVLLGLLISVPLLMIVILLLCFSDAVFADFFNKLLSPVFSNIFLPNLFGIFFMAAFSFFAAYCIFTRLNSHHLSETAVDRRTGEPVTAITVTGLLSAVYLLYCFIQVKYLFLGYGTLPENYTYASYAREGFFQLVFVCLINLLLVFICITCFRKNSILKIILTLISICTYIMIASSIYRMLLYIRVYHLTFLRVFVLWSLAVILLLMTGVLIMVYRETFPLFKYSLIVVTLLYLIFSLSKPDYFIAEYNIDHIIPPVDTSDGYGYDAYYDYHYLCRLSQDAAPVVYAKAKETGYGNSPWFEYYVERTTTKASLSGSLRTFNFSRQAAYQSLEKYNSFFSSST